MKFSTAARLSIAAGITAVLASLVVLTGFGSGGWLLGGLGDFMDVVNSALIIPLFFFLGELMRPLHARLGRAIQVVGAAGALLRLAGAFLILVGLVPFDNAVLFVNGGMGLIGLAMLLFLTAGRGLLAEGSGYYVFSVIVGLSLLLNILGVFLYDAYAPLLNGEVGFADMNPLLLGLLVFAPIQILGYPIWLLWTGRLLLRAPGNQTLLTEWR